jgi:hypothetical protein
MNDDCLHATNYAVLLATRLYRRSPAQIEREYD